LVWFGLVWFGLVWFGLVWFGLVFLVVGFWEIENRWKMLEICADEMRSRLSHH